MTTRIAVDAMGGDRAPVEIVAGALAAADETIRPILFGPAGLESGGLELVEASQLIGMEETPVQAVRAKPDSSLVAACRAVGEGRADAVVSAGNTGAMLSACLFELRRLEAVSRPAIAVTIPSRRGPSVLIDAGANVDSRPQHLLQFAFMGAAFAEEIIGVKRPEVRLLSIGAEPEKGNQVTREAHGLLAASGLNFRGNAEGQDLLRGAGDVIVCDGFTGNIALKVIEGSTGELQDALRKELEASARGKLGGALIAPSARRLRNRLDPDVYGGAYLLGLRGLAVIAHGSSGAKAVANAIRLAARGVERDLVGRLAARLRDSRPAIA